MKLRKAAHRAQCVGNRNLARKEGKQGRAEGRIEGMCKKKPLRLKIDRIFRQRKENGIHAVSAIRDIFIRTTQKCNIY